MTVRKPVFGSLISHRQAHRLTGYAPATPQQPPIFSAHVYSAFRALWARHDRMVGVVGDLVQHAGIALASTVLAHTQPFGAPAATVSGEPGKAQ